MQKQKTDEIWVVDFGSQYTQLIIRRCREIGYKCVLQSVSGCLEKMEEGFSPSAIILSGGPQSVFEDQTNYAPIFNLEIPILGICYGMQLMAQYFGGTVEKGILGEYGKTKIKNNSKIFSSIQGEFEVWMSHSDHVTVLPLDFEVTLKSHNDLVAGIIHNHKPYMGLQFHPEVAHSQNGEIILQIFLKEIAKLSPNWSDKDLLMTCENEIKQIAQTLKEGEYVLCAFSGGVDSLVAASITSKILSKKLFCVFVDHGLLRPQDLIHMKTLKEETDLQIITIDARNEFMLALKNVSEPEAKRKIIGSEFITCFEKHIQKIEKEKGITFSYLLQGTLYPDVIESLSPLGKDGKSTTIKSHHNVGGLPERMNLKLLEPLRYLFKDEVRALGKLLSLKSNWLFRHPFPGPGLGVRILGEIDQESIRKVQESDQILFEELQAHDLYSHTWQAFTVLLPIQTVGVKGDGRVYENVICLRMVNSTDGMTATWSRMPFEFLDKVSSRICNEVKGVTRTVYDITSKPPATIEWE